MGDFYKFNKGNKRTEVIGRNANFVLMVIKGKLKCPCPLWGPTNSKPCRSLELCSNYWFNANTTLALMYCHIFHTLTDLYINRFHILTDHPTRSSELLIGFYNGDLSEINTWCIYRKNNTAQLHYIIKKIQVIF